MDLSPIEYLDRAVYLPTVETLIVADLHVGRAATSDVELPMGEKSDLLDRLRALVETVEPERVVVAGDVLHSFSSVPYGVPDTLSTIETTIVESGTELVLIAGNHDTILPDVVEVAIEDSVELEDGTVVHHGHELPEVEAPRYVIGHEHPAIVIEGDRHPCFLEGMGQWNGAKVVVLPAFSRFAKGTVINTMETADVMSPLLSDLDACRPVVRSSDKSLSFPPLGEIRSLL